MGSLRFADRPALLAGLALLAGQALGAQGADAIRPWLAHLAHRGLAGAVPITALGAVVWVLVALPRHRSGRCAMAALVLASAAQGALWPERAAPETHAEAPIGRHVPAGRANVGRLHLQDGSRSPWLFAYEGTPPRPGEWIRVLGPGERRRFAQGPRAPDVDAPLGIWTVAPDECRRVAPAPHPGARIAASVRPLREALVTRLERAGVASGLGPALLVGDKGTLTREDRDRFTHTGTRHLLALSGLHVGLLAVGLLWPLQRLMRALALALGAGARAAEVGALVLGSGLVLGFLPLAGGQAPVARAGFAVLAAQLAGAVREGGERRVPGRRVDVPSLWGAALALECIVNPTAHRELAVQLSYAATAGILVGAAPIARLLRRAGTEHARLADAVSRPPMLPAALRAVLRRLGRGVALGLGASLAATLATVPFTWSRFGELSLAGPFATLLATPVLAVWLPLLWLSALTAWEPVGALALGCEQTVRALLDACTTLPGTPVALPLRPAWLLVSAVALAFAALAGRRMATERAAWLAWAILLGPWELAPARFELCVLDVGHGCAMLVRAPGMPALAFDAGSRDRPGIATRALAPVLRAWDPGVVALVGSHSDRDHRADLPWIAARYTTAFQAGHLAPELDEALSPTTPRLDLERGALELPLRPGPVRARLVRGGPWPGNEGSRSLVLEVAGEAVVLAGDAVGPGLAAELDAGLLPARPRLLVAPHHGSFGRSVVRELSELAPGEVWVSASGTPPMVPEYDRRGLTWRATGHHGALSLRLPETGRNPPPPAP